MRVALLCGAGLSIPYKMPSTSEITRAVLSGEGFARHTENNYYRMPRLYGWPDEYVPKVCAFLAILKSECERFFKGEQDGHKTNYEDLFYMVAQIRDSEFGEYENPAILPLSEKICNSPGFEQNLSMRQQSQNLTFVGLCEETCTYIKCVVWHMLQRRLNLKSLDLLEGLCEDHSVKSVDIFTLNHDTVIESLCAERNIGLTDGFGEPSQGVRWWNPALFDTDAKRIRLLKLHGSVNWFEYDSADYDWSSRGVAIPLNNDLWHTKNKDGTFRLPKSGRPAMLIGTFNKMMSYTMGIFADLHFRFYRDLPLADAVIVSGYSFGDKGINSRLLDWGFAPGTGTIVVVDPGEPLQHARGAVQRCWNDWVAKGKIHWLSESIENVSWATIKEILQRTARLSATT